MRKDLTKDYDSNIVLSVDRHQHELYFVSNTGQAIKDGYLPLRGHSLFPLSCCSLDEIWSNGYLADDQKRNDEIFETYSEFYESPEERFPEIEKELLSLNVKVLGEANKKPRIVRRAKVTQAQTIVNSKEEIYPVMAIEIFIKEYLVKKEGSRMASGEVRKIFLKWYQVQYKEDIAEIINETRWGLELKKLGIHRKQGKVNNKNVNAIIDYSMKES